MLTIRHISPKQKNVEYILCLHLVNVTWPCIIVDRSWRVKVKVTVSCGLWTAGHASLDTPPPSPARYPAYCSFPGNNRIPQNVTISLNPPVRCGRAMMQRSPSPSLSHTLLTPSPPHYALRASRLVYAELIRAPMRTVLSTATHTIICITAISYSSYPCTFIVH